MNTRDTGLKDALAHERQDILRQLENWLEVPMLVLSVAWTALLILELVQGLSSLLHNISVAIWIMFGLDFALRFFLAPSKTTYLKSDWLTAIALLAPGLRMLRLARVARAARSAQGLRLLNVFASINQGMQALGHSLGRRGFGYLAALSVLIVMVGAAGMYAFEREAPGGPGFDSYATALWWTAMLLTTMGSDYWLKTPEARVLCVILAVYAFAIFGYVTAALASFFVGRDAEDERAELAGKSSVQALQADIHALREEVRQLATRVRH